MINCAHYVNVSNGYTPFHRVTEMYDRGDREEVPSPNDLVGSNKWRDVSTDLARYELR